MSNAALSRDWITVPYAEREGREARGFTFDCRMTIHLVHPCTGSRYAGGKGRPCEVAIMWRAREALP